MAVASRMLKDLAIDVPVNVLFEMPTIEGLAAYIDQGGHVDEVKKPSSIRQAPAICSLSRLSSDTASCTASWPNKCRNTGFTRSTL
ncbi:hypothetical protein PO124_23490 [Bacillus licheniformis]|nr:hypothetical protein [Bacillus licheniformis]